MDFVRYAEAAADLVNTDLVGADGPDLAALRGHLADRQRLLDQCTERDCVELDTFRASVRPVFAASAGHDHDAVVTGLNRLLQRHPITPQISDHEPDNLHLHVATSAASVADLLISEALLGLATLVCDLGADRLGGCAAQRCDNVFVDTSPNRSRRYCSDRCSSRANVAAYRARRRAAAAG